MRHPSLSAGVHDVEAELVDEATDGCLGRLVISRDDQGTAVLAAGWLSIGGERGSVNVIERLDHLRGRQVRLQKLRGGGRLVVEFRNVAIPGLQAGDGHIPELDNESTTTAELLQAHLPTSKVVKAFNHIYAAALTTDGQPAGSKNRRALVIAGDDQAAKATVSRLIDQFGFDVVDAGPLKEGWRIQRDTPGYGPRRTADEIRRDLAAAKRYADQ